MGKLIGIIHKKPKEGGISAVGGTGSIYTYYGPDEAKFANLTNNFLTKDIDSIMPSLGLPNEPIPLWWTTDFILASPEGIPAEDKEVAKKYGDMMGEVALSILSKSAPAEPSRPTTAEPLGPVDISSLTRVAADDLGMLPQPAN